MRSCHQPQNLSFGRGDLSGIARPLPSLRPLGQGRNVTRHAELLDMVIVGVLAWAIPLVLLILFFRTLATIVAGLRSINDATQRIADSVEKLAARDVRTRD